MVLDPKIRKKKILNPVKKVVKEVMKGLKELELSIPISRIARMDIDHTFEDESLVEFKKTVVDYMKVVNSYRQLYFDFMKKTKTVFDAEMTKDGSFAPGIKQYNSIKNQISDSLLKTDGKAWILSYDQYLPTIREHANKRSKKPRSGKKIYSDLKIIFKKDMKNIKNSRKLSFRISKLLFNDINYWIKHPELEWQQWLVEDGVSKLDHKPKLKKD